MSTVKFDTWQNTDGTENYKCRAWVNFDGRGITIRGSGNVSSITDNDTGDYTVNFTTALADANYVVVGSTGTTANGDPPSTLNTNRARGTGNHVDSTTTAVRISIDPVSNGDSKYVSVAVFR